MPGVCEDITPTGREAVSKEFGVPITIDQVYALALNISCDWCHAVTGDPCVTKKGKPYSKWVHGCRIAPMWVAYQAGYHNGRKSMKEEIEIKEAHPNGKTSN